MKTIRIYWNANPEPSVSYLLTVIGPNGTDSYSGPAAEATFSRQQGEALDITLVATGPDASPSNPVTAQFTVPVDGTQYSTPTGLNIEVIA